MPCVHLVTALTKTLMPAAAVATMMTTLMGTVGPQLCVCQRGLGEGCIPKAGAVE